MPDATGTLAAYSIVSWVRRGMASLVTEQPTTNYASLPVSISVNGTAVSAPSVRLLGPGDITGMDSRAVIRTNPSNTDDAFEPNYLAMVELALPDLPWMFSPSGDVNGYLQPWICLVVLPDGPGAEIDSTASGLSVLRITAPLDPKAELPDLKTIGTWAHAQLTGASGTDVNAAFQSDTAGTLSRLISPRKLEPGKAYLACVVPTYHAGVSAALGLAVNEKDIAPAWDSSVSAPFVLPVYYSFRFQTGASGDFGSLARAIKPATAVTAGTRAMGVSDPQFGVSPVTEAPAGSAESTLDLEGALRTIDSSGKTYGLTATWPDDKLQGIFEQKLRPSLGGSSLTPPVVSPPTYGSAQSGHSLPAAASPPAPPVWLGELNLDPRTRAAASAGAQVVQKNQDALVASTWEQAGDIRKANRLLQQGQLAREVSTSMLKRHLSAVKTEGVLLQMTNPMHQRVAVAGSKTTLRGSIAASILPDGTVSGAMRKLTRSRGPIGRQVISTKPPIVDRLNMPASAGAAALQVTRPLTAPRGMVAFDNVEPKFPGIQKDVMLEALAATVSGWRISSATEVSPAAAPLTPSEGAHPDLVHEGVLQGATLKPKMPIIPVIVGGATTISSLTNDWNTNVPAALTVKRRDLPAPLAFPTSEAGLTSLHSEFQKAASLVVGYIGDAPPAEATAQPLPSVRTQLLARINPELTIKMRVGARIPVGTDPDPLQLVRTGPAFPSAPMYIPLADLSPEWMLPGLSSIPINSATLLEPNPQFIESYMVGLNEELSKELLWRQFPAAINQTYFQNFWTSSLGGASSVTDIPEIQRFDSSKHLGQHVNDLASSQTVVLVIRANLFRRYPNAIVSLVQAKWVDSPAGKERTLAGPFNYPNFRGEIGLDTTFFGFALDDLNVDPGPPPQVKPQNPADLQGSDDPKDNKAGWYFVIEEHLAEPRFGLEPDEQLDQPQAVGSTEPVWADLSWLDLPAKAVSGSTAPTFLDPAVLPAKHPTLEGVTWGANAASMAYILMREPVRIALHALALLEIPAKADHL